MEIIGEFIVEVLAYGTHTIMKSCLSKLPIPWNRRVLNVLSAMIGILVWVILVVVVIKVFEKIL